MTTKFVALPPMVSVSAAIGGNTLRQWRRGPTREFQSVGRYRSDVISGLLLTSNAGATCLVVPEPHVPTIQVDSILVCPKPDRVLDGTESHFSDSRVTWLRPAVDLINPPDFSRIRHAADNARSSWQDKFLYREEHQDASGATLSVGLRPPQIGAIHAAIGHWRAQEDPATIVMPTGTGKTETMLALLLAEQIHRLFIVLPTDALRSQIAQKFLSLGLLPTLGVIDSDALPPVVATLSENFRNPADIDLLLPAANVVITTAALVSRYTPELQARIAAHCSHLFIDEAHHVPANTWYAFRQRFREKRVLQFTATPFRRDGRLVDGRQIFSYSLRKAQEDGYFRPLKFVPIDIFPEDTAHPAIAAAAMRQLSEDTAAGFDHLVMARVSTIKRAKALLKIYQERGAKNAIVVHSRLSDRQLDKCMTALRTRKSRVAICVDMFGEGFDMPELKIAALHDVHKSLTTTLQFVGRFTRSAPNVGVATLIANIGDLRVEGALRELYQEDSDWNALLPGVAERFTRRHRERTEFINSFAEPPADIPLQAIEPKMSALVYRTTCADWAPEKAAASIPVETPSAGPVINQSRTVSLFITREVSPVDWARIASPSNTAHHLYLAYWDRDRELLFLNSSNHDIPMETFARDVSKGTAKLIDGEDVFRALKGLSRLSLMNLGLKHTLNRATRFTMYVGSDIIQGLSESGHQNRIKTNLFGKGYENGERATVGCSLKGKIWSHRVAEDISEWIEWCTRLGTKLLDRTTTIDRIFSNVIWPAVVNARPPLFPIGIDWPDAFILRYDVDLLLEVDGLLRPFFDTQLQLVSPDETSPLGFSVSIDATHTAVYEFAFSSDGATFIPVTSRRAFLHFERRGRVPIEQFFFREPPIVRFANGSWLEGNWLFPPSPLIAEPFTRERIEVWDWTGIDLTCESQGSSKRADSIQFRALEHLKAGALGCEYDLLVDDDGSNEVADIVALKVTSEHELVIHLVHCKFSQEPQPGARIEDLYAVCGQAQKSVSWRGNVERMLDMLISRDVARIQRTGVSGIEVGNSQIFRRLRRQAHLLSPRFAVWIVQPGLSKALASTNQLHLLAVTELYLKETYAAPFAVIGSA